MIDYNKIELGDILKITGAGAPGYYKIGEFDGKKIFQSPGLSNESR
ncbi:MAG: hypothetical protein PHX80_04130 [Candidatus Nanoarchaeia archaeon]|nr:hypothetical protein [Candidatus Nanoarchaeia archaeon]